MNQTKGQQNEGAADLCGEQEIVQVASQPLVWYCPSRWLLAHHDLRAGINTMSSHMCLADLNNDGENLLALIDFKQTEQQTTMALHTAKPPYECRMRVYRAQQLIYNHFLEDIPSCLIVSSISLPAAHAQPRARVGNNHLIPKIDSMGGQQKHQQGSENVQQQPLLTLAINDDIYFYHKLKPSHKLSLEDDDCIMNSLNRAEVDAWHMVRQNKVDYHELRELLLGLSQEHGSHELSSHTQNFIALQSDEDRKQYLVAWKLKKLQQNNNLGEQIMSMDTISCSAARLRYSSSITKSGDFGRTREQTVQVGNSNLDKLPDLQKDGLLLGTEDRHLLIYEMRSIRTRLECHYRLQAVPDHILVERRSPSSIASKQDLHTRTYKILVSCRNCRIYSIDQLYQIDEKSSPCKVTELIALKSNVLDMSWTGMADSAPETGSFLIKGVPEPYATPNFVVACLDGRVYCFGSHDGSCKWIIEHELPITCLFVLPTMQIGAEEASLVGVASKANRVDFYVGSTGRIVDSIYFNQDDYPQAMTFGRFGREDNCLCLVTSLGRLAVFILKRTARFAHGQCLSSAASYASNTLVNCRQILQDSTDGCDPSLSNLQTVAGLSEANQQTEMRERSNLPSAFDLSKSNSASATDQVIDSMLQSDHKCDQASIKTALESQTASSQLPIPVKGRDFVEQVVEQSRMSRQMARVFANQLVKLRDKVRSNFSSSSKETPESGNRLILSRVVGLGSVYKVHIAIKLNVEKFVERYSHLLADGSKPGPETIDSSTNWSLTCLLKPRKSNLSGRKSQVSPSKFEMPMERDSKADFLVKAICETTIGFKLSMVGPSLEPLESEFVPLDVLILARCWSKTQTTTIQRPFLETTMNVPLQSS